MQMRHVVYVAAFALMLSVAAGTVKAKITASGSYNAVLAQHALGTDAAVADADWSRGKLTDAVPFEDLTTRSAAPLATTAYMLYDARNLYVAFKAEQPGVPIAANQPTNNVGFGLDDFVGIGIDTSGNGTTVYYFETTPRGTRYQQASESSRYSPVWRSAARVDSGAWTAVMTIPLNALHRS